MRGAARLIAALLLSSSSACSGDASSTKAPESVSVRIASVQRAPLERILRGTGTLFGEEETTVSAKVAGRVKAVLHDLGDEVGVGESLLEIDETDYVLERNARVDGARQVLSQIGLARLPEDESDVSALPSVKRARLNAQNIKARYNRVKKLHDQVPPLLSDQDLNDAETAYAVAENDLRLAELNARSQIAEARAMFSQAELAEQEVRDTVHTVPSGSRPASRGQTTPEAPRYLVASRLVSVGDYVGVGTALFRLVDPDPLKLRVPIPERHLGRISTGQKAAVTTDAYSSAFEGTISRISPAVNIQSRTFDVEITVPNGERKLRSGMFARADISIGAEPAPMIPQSAVRAFAGITKVITVVDGKANESQVTLGQKHGDRVEVLSGLDDGAVVVLEPPIELTSGMPVIVANDSGSTEKS